MGNSEASPDAQDVAEMHGGRMLGDGEAVSWFSLAGDVCLVLAGVILGRQWAVRTPPRCLICGEVPRHECDGGTVKP